MSTSKGERRRRARTSELESLSFVLQAVRSGHADTRQEIEHLSGFGRSVVADRVATLMSLGLIREEGLGPSTGGRAPRRLRFNAEAGYVLTSSLGTTTVGVGLADLSGHLLVEHHEAADATLPPAMTVGRIVELFDWMLRERPDAQEAWAITLAVPGLVGPGGGRLGSHPTVRHMPGWRGYPVHHELSERFGAPVLVDNEAHHMALGELRNGHGAGRESLVFVKVGTGISAGLCLGGHIHRGATGFAGDIGHVAIEDESPTICRCGNTGCLEAIAGGSAIAREGQAAALDGRSPYLAEQLEVAEAISAWHVGTGANRGDPFSVQLISRSGQLVGETLATLVTAVDPSLVVVGGGVAQAGAILMAAIRDGIYRRSRSIATESLQVVRSELGKTAGLLGGAHAALDELFEPSYLKTWVRLGTPRAPSTARPRSDRLGRTAHGPAAAIEPSVSSPVAGNPVRDQGEPVAKRFGETLLGELPDSIRAT